MMMLSEVESRLLGIQMEQSKISNLIYSQSGARNYDEAITEIAELKKALTSLHIENKHYE